MLLSKYKTKQIKKGKKIQKQHFGGFSGINLLSGKGPKIKVEIETVGNVETDLKSEFLEQGINQTLHRVFLQVKCKVSILTPFEIISEDITNQVLIMENVIMGKVPEAYYNIEGLDRNEALEFIE